MTKWICDRADVHCKYPCYAECECVDGAPVKCLFGNSHTPKWERVQDEPEQKQEKSTMPDWVEIGGYVYCPRNGYGKFISGSVKSCYIEFDGGAGDFTAESISQLFLPARLRPYNAEELKALVGKVIESKDKVDCLLVTAYNSGKELDDVAAVMTLGEWGNAEDLLRIGYTIDGKPCGVFEHLENGEWNA